MADDDLLNRVSALRTKAQALYEKAARPIKDDGEPIFEDNAAKMGTVHIRDATIEA